MKLSNAIILLMSMFFSVFLGGTAVRSVAVSRKENEPLVVVDAGHGGVDGGVTGVKTGVKEADVNLAVAKALKERLEAGGITVVMTRSTPAALYGGLSDGFKRKDLKKRVELANSSGADLFISVHMNEYSDSSRRGAQVFYRIKDEKSRLLAESLQNSFNGMEEATRSFSALAGGYYVLNNSEMPAVLCECGFLSNPEDEALLVTDEYQKKLAYAIYKGIIEYFSNLQ